MEVDSAAGECQNVDPKSCFSKYAVHANIPAEKGVMGDYRSQRPTEQMMCQISVCHMLLVEIGVCRSSHLVPLSSYICTH